MIRDRSDPPTPAAPPSQEAGSFFRPRYLPWAKWIARVFAAACRLRRLSAWAAPLPRESEVLVCPLCGGAAEGIAAALL